VLATIGGGKIGGDIRKVLGASPFGWPKDAVDAALIALHRSQHVSAILNGAPIPPGQLDQNKISKAEFRVEQITLNVNDRLAIRKLFQALGITCKGEEMAARAPEFLDKLLALAQAAGGDPPLPKAPKTGEILDIRAMVGTEQLACLRDRADDLKNRIAEWQSIRALSETRLPIWATLEALERHASGLPGASDVLDQMAAIKAQRLLLEATDPVSPLRGSLVDMLRKALADSHDAHARAHEAGIAKIESSSSWQRLAAEDRAGILASVGLTPPMAVPVSSDEALIAALDAKPLSARRAETDAVVGRVAQALERAAKMLEPKVRSVAVERATLTSEDDVRSWADRQQQALLSAIKDGPVLVN
jgi:hypothetical protein